ASVMPMALATTEVSLTASVCPPPAYPGPPVPEVFGDVDAVGVGDAALATRGARTAAPPAPPTNNAPATMAFAVRPTRLDGGGAATESSGIGPSEVKSVS